jgi:sulfotransferase
MKTYHFISGLPRSGSTLLSSILKQNPNVYADISSPVEGLCTSSIDLLTGCESNSIVNEERRKVLLQHIFEGFYSYIDKEIIVDTSRAWTKKTTLLKTLFPDTKILCCVRDIVDILNSFETIFKKNPMYTNTLVKEDVKHHVFSRCDAMMDNKEGIITTNWLNLQEGYYTNPEMIYFVEYEKMCKEPESTMKEIYEFLNQPYYSHDFDNLEYSNEPFDMSCNLKNLHTVKTKVEYNPPRMILPPEMIEKYSSANMEFWKNLNSPNKSSVKTLLSYK